LHKLKLLRTYFKANTTFKQACTLAYTKLDKYYKIIKKQDFVVIAIVCNLWFNFNIFYNFYKDFLNTNTHKIRI